MPAIWSLLRALAALGLLRWTALSFGFVDGVRSEQQIPLSVVKLWASAFGGEIRSIAAKYSGSQLLQKITKGRAIGRMDYFYRNPGLSTSDTPSTNSCVAN